MGCCCEASNQPKATKQSSAKKPINRVIKSPERPPTDHEEQPSGLDLQQFDYPEDEVFDQNVDVDELIAGLNWFAQFQVSLMSKRKNKDEVSGVFIDKLNQEMKQSEVVVYREFSKSGQDEEFSIECFANMDLQALSQLLGTFMPIVKLKKENSYLIGTEVKQMTVRGENCMVRVGGGYVTIAEYYNKYSTKQCVSLYQQMSANSMTFVDAILHLMQTQVASEDIIAAYRDGDGFWDDTNKLFVLIATFVEQKLKEESAKQQRPKKGGKKGKKKVSGADALYSDYGNTSGLSPSRSFQSP